MFTFGFKKTQFKYVRYDFYGFRLSIGLKLFKVYANFGEVKQAFKSEISISAYILRKRGRW